MQQFVSCPTIWRGRFVPHRVRHGVGGWCSFQATCLTALSGHTHGGAGASPLEEAMLAAVSGTAMAGGKNGLYL